MLTQLPKIKKAIDEEHLWLEKVIGEYSIDMIVSDNRYGLWSKKIESILITHQLFIKAPTGEWLIEKILNNYLANFNEIWIPDVQGKNNLSGDLAHKKPLPDNYKFIGIQSRFSNQIVTSSVPKAFGTYREDNFEYDFMAIISGPEPQRTIFEKLVIEQVENTNLKGVLVRGLPDDSCHSEFIEEDKKTLRQAQCDRSDEIASSFRKLSEFPRNDDQLEIFNHLETNEFLKYIQKSKVVVSRSGYSTIMDLTALGKKGILVPTPGQTEQEYLAKYHHEKGQFYTQKQSEFDLKKSLNEIKRG
jgi:UDP-N-acetylglucosamine transferase subunit ALG13